MTEYHKFLSEVNLGIPASYIFFSFIKLSFINSWSGWQNSNIKATVYLEILQGLTCKI